MIRKLLASLALLYLAWCFVLLFLQTYIIFPGVFVREAGDAALQPANVESIWLDIGGGERVEGWFIPGRGCSAGKPGPLLVYAHGNAALIDDYPTVFAAQVDWGLSVFLPEYRGYGRSGGRPGEAAIVADCVALLDRVLARPDVDRTRVAYHGQSLGGGVIVQVAARRPPRALILESTFTSLLPLAGRYGAPTALLSSTFRSDEALPKLDIPVLIFHGSRDRTIPIEHGRTLARLAQNGHLIEYDKDHNQGPPDWQMHLNAQREFMRETGVLPE